MGYKATCPQCGKELVEREGKYGVFIGCTGYPICRYTREKIDNEYYFLKTEVRLVELMDWRDRLNKIKFYLEYVKNKEDQEKEDINATLITITQEVHNLEGLLTKKIRNIKSKIVEMEEFNSGITTKKAIS